MLHFFLILLNNDIHEPSQKRRLFFLCKRIYCTDRTPIYIRPTAAFIGMTAAIKYHGELSIVCTRRRRTMHGGAAATHPQAMRKSSTLRRPPPQSIFINNAAAAHRADGRRQIGYIRLIPSNPQPTRRRPPPHCRAPTGAPPPSDYQYYFKIKKILKTS